MIRLVRKPSSSYFNTVGIRFQRFSVTGSSGSAQNVAVYDDDNERKLDKNEERFANSRYHCYNTAAPRFGHGNLLHYTNSNNNTNNNTKRAFSTTPFNNKQQIISSAETDQSINDTITNMLQSQSLGQQDPGATTTTINAAMESFDTFERIGWPSDYMIDAIFQISNYTGCGIAYSILGFTVGFRLLLSPLYIKSQRNSSRMAHMKPEMDLLKERIDKDKNRDMEANARLNQQMRSLFKKYDCSPAFGLLLPLIQMPVFMSMFFALQRLPELFQNTLTTEGLLWFPDLGAPDPYFILPALTAGSFFLTIEASKEGMLATGAQGKTILNVMRGMAVLMIPFTAYFPAVMFVYWLPNNLFSLSSTLVLTRPFIKKQFGIWDPPKTPPGTLPPKGIMDQLQEQFAQKEATKTERHNENIIRMNLERAESARINHQLRLSKIRDGSRKKKK